MLEFEEITENIQEAPKKVTKWFKKNKVLGIGAIAVGGVALYVLYKRKTGISTASTSEVYYVPSTYDGYPEMSESMYNDMFYSGSGEAGESSSDYNEFVSDVTQAVTDMQIEYDNDREELIQTFASERLNYEETISYLEEQRQKESVINQMANNSNLYALATTDEQREALREANQQLGASIGATFDSETGTWWSNGERLYFTNREISGIDTPVTKPVTNTDRNTSPTSTADRTRVINQMQENSAKWASASAEERKALEKANQQLGASIGATFNSSTGVWYADKNTKLYESVEKNETTTTTKTNTSSKGASGVGGKNTVIVNGRVVAH